MRKQRQTKSLTPADGLKMWLLCGKHVGNSHTRNITKVISLWLAAHAWCIMPTHADTVYRCGEAYSASSQCASAAAIEVKPSSLLHTTGQGKNNTTANDMRDAQALEQQRLQAERQATQTAPVRFSTPHAPPASPANKDPLPNKGKHVHQPRNPYFTAIDPNTAPKKKSTAKAVPATSSP